MPNYDRVQMLPGTPRIFAIEVGTGWETLPSIPGWCVVVFLRPRSSNDAAIYIADRDLTNGASPGPLNRAELAATDFGISYEIYNPDMLQVAAASGTQVLEVHCIIAGQP